MKKVMAFFLLAMLLATSALADVIIEPADDFYNAHSSECEYLPRKYTTNGPEGYVALWKSPASPQQTETMKNGETVWCGFLYTDGAGKVWGTVFGEDFREELRGWADLSEWVAVPDYLDFEEAYGGEFVDYDSKWGGTMDGYEEVYLWDYPCSGGEPRTMTPSWFSNEGTAIKTCWVDGEGRTWGFSAYAGGIRNTWVCLSDPANPDIPADPAVLKSDVKWVAPAGELPQAGTQMPVMTIALVAGVVAVTAVLIVVLYRKKGAR